MKNIFTFVTEAILGQQQQQQQKNVKKIFQS